MSSFSWGRDQNEGTRWGAARIDGTRADWWGHPMREALKRHWPEYLMEAAGLGLFMLSACIFATILGHPSSPVPRPLPIPWRAACSWGWRWGWRHYGNSAVTDNRGSVLMPRSWRKSSGSRPPRTATRMRTYGLVATPSALTDPSSRDAAGYRRSSPRALVETVARVPVESPAAL
jgi:hypothetical protein